MRRIGSALVVVAAFGDFIAAQPARAQPLPPPAQAPPPPQAAPWPAYPMPYDAAPRLRQPMSAPTGPVVSFTTDNATARLQIMQLKWRDVCRSPCGIPVDPGGLYRIGGGTVRPSESFRMPRPSGTVQIEAEVGSTVKHWVGFGMIIGGAVGMGLGGLIYAAGANASTDPGNDLGDVFKTEGVFFLIIGAIVTAIGIPLAASSTSVDVR